MTERIREEQNRIADRHLETALLEGLDSGEAIEVDDEWLSRKRAELTARFAADGNPKQ